MDEPTKKSLDMIIQAALLDQTASEFDQEWKKAMYTANAALIIIQAQNIRDKAASLRRRAAMELERGPCGEDRPPEKHAKPSTK